jgi:hypothetical protein
MKYPAPTRAKWSVAVEFHNGSRIEGTSATDILERWGAIAQWAHPGEPLPLAVMKARAARLAHNLTGGTASPTLGDEDFLDRLAEIGALRVIRR